MKNRRLAWALVTREAADLFRYNGPIVSDLLRDYGPQLAKLIREDGADVAVLLEAVAALLDPGVASQEALEGAETP